MVRWFLILVACALGSVACREERAPASVASSRAPQPVASATPAKGTSVPVQTYGELHAMMMEGKTDSVVNIGSIDKPTTYAIGALSELRGEVTILDGTVWLAYPGEGDETKVESSTTSKETAALLVAANVASWKSIPIQSDIGASELDKQVEALARAAGVDVEQPFPVIVEGDLAGLHWHVIDGRRMAPGPSSHEQHMQAAAKGAAPDVHATLIGFFSKHHQGVFTHHGQNTHFHFVDAAKRQTGHVDSVEIKKGAVLKVPA